MHHRPTRLLLAASLGVALGLFQLPAQGALYRWVDEEGRVHFTDKLPAESARHKQERIDERGFTVETVQERELTEEERAAAERKLQEEEEQQRLKDEQLAYDRRLLRTYETLDDLMMARDGKLAAVDSQVRLAEGQIREREDLLARQHKRAAELERSGKPLDKKLQDAIATTLRQIATSRERIAELEKEKAALRVEYDAEIVRYRELKGIRD
jgi:hypothetical protein